MPFVYLNIHDSYPISPIWNVSYIYNILVWFMTLNLDYVVVYKDNNLPNYYLMALIRQLLLRTSASV